MNCFGEQLLGVSRRFEDQRVGSNVAILSVSRYLKNHPIVVTDATKLTNTTLLS